MFHSHYFKPSDKDPEIIYCHCGSIKDIHRHIWEHWGEAKGYFTGMAVILKCKVCGEMKSKSGANL